MHTHMDELLKLCLSTDLLLHTSHHTYGCASCHCSYKATSALSRAYILQQNEDDNNYWLIRLPSTISKIFKLFSFDLVVRVILLLHGHVCLGAALKLDGLTVFAL